MFGLLEMIKIVIVSKAKVGFIINLLFLFYFNFLQIKNNFNMDKLFFYTLQFMLIVLFIRKIKWVHQFIVGTPLALALLFTLFGSFYDREFESSFLFLLVKLWIIAIILLINFYFYKNQLVDKFI